MLDHRPQQVGLVDVLEGAAAFEDRGGRTADEDDGRLGQGGVFEGGDGIGHAGAGRYGRHPRSAREPCRGIGGKHRIDFMAHVDDADTGRPGRHQDGRDMPPAQGKQAGYLTLGQKAGDHVAPVEIHTASFYLWLSEGRIIRIP